MPAYVVFTRLKTKDQSELDTYAEKGGATMAGRSFTPHVAYGEQTILEGPEHEGIAILSFATRADAEDWYYSPAYQDARAHRAKGGDYSVTIVEGF